MFSVTGEFLTQHARDLVLGDMWEKAIKFLDSVLHCGVDIAIQVASGESKLVGGNNGILSVPEDGEVRKSHEEEVNFIYQGRFETPLAGGRSWVKPVAYVTSFGKGDIYGTPFYQMSPDEPLPKIYSVMSDNAGNRAKFYCRHQGEWVLGFGRLSSRKYPIICEMCPPAPVWFPQKTLDEAVIESEFDLEERGWLIHCRDQDIDVDPGYRPLHDMARVEIETPTENDLVEYLQNTRERIIRVTDKWYTFRSCSERVKVPYHAFFKWAFRDDYSFPYEEVSESGLRMYGDTPVHSDWMIGSIFEDIKNFIPWENFEKLGKMGWEERYFLNSEKYSSDITILSSNSRGIITGKVVHPKRGEKVQKDCIAVIPNASTDYVQAAFTALAIITEVGGNFSHLVNVYDGVAFLRVEDALKKFPSGSIIEIDLDNKSVSIRE